MSNPNKTSTFKERQKFNQPWLFLLLICIDLALFAAFIFQVYFHKSIGTRPMTNTGYLISILIINLVIALLYYSTLKTLINEEGIALRFSPFHLKWKVYKWNEIETAYVRPFHAILEYGGWGLKYGGNGWSYTTSGDIGIQIVLKNGKTILLGTQKPMDSAAILNTKFPTGHLIY